MYIVPGFFLLSGYSN